MSDLRIDAVHKHYGAMHAVRGIDLSIDEGAFAVLVGPSGCGKSTLLRMIAGLETIDDGTIYIGGQPVNDLRPRDRNVAMVFQNYALYPYLSVFENIAFPLRARKLPQDEVEARVHDAAATLGLDALLSRKPRQLSGGQRQRVAIGRAIVRDAGLFLFDEPLSNLDAQLRDEMRVELKRLHQTLGKTFIYVTHDQIEAMTLADRIVLMREGKIEQQGAPLDLFERPQTRFVASFLGSPPMNFIPGTAEGDTIALADGVHLTMPGGRSVPSGGVIVGVRPEHFFRADGDTADIQARVDLVQPTGTRTYVQFRLGGELVTAEIAAHSVEREGETIALNIDLSRAVLFDPQKGDVLHPDSPPS